MAKSKPRKQRAEQKPQQQCIFCQGYGMTKQHIWPDWMARDSSLPTYEGKAEKKNTQVLTPPLNIFTANGKLVIQAGMPTIIERQGSTGSRKLRLVCKACNGGWMSRVESDSQNTIASLMLSTQFVLSRDEQEKLAAWATLMVMVNEFTDIKTKSIIYSERHFFKENKRPPEGWTIWIGRNKASEWHQRMRHASFFLGKYLLAEGPPAITDTKPNSQSTSLAVGGLFLFIISTSNLEYYDFVSSYNHDSLIKIWPVSQESIDLSALPIILNDEALRISDSLSSEVNKMRIPPYSPDIDN
jgi:hypothetical protein